MDTIVLAAVEEICAQGSNGISLSDLWPKLQPSLSSASFHLSDTFKRAIWNGILNTPGLQFGLQDASMMSFEEFEKNKLKIVAEEHLRDSFIGLYDIKAADAGISPAQRRVLELLAIARTNGITQSQLAKELGMKGNQFFYIVRNLECRGLIVRQSTIVRTKEATVEEENGSKSTSVVNTNLIHLYRYGKHLTSHQRLEITKEDTLDNLRNAEGSNSIGDGITGGECLKEDVLIKDYLPALRAVCDKLEEADGKVLVVADIKQALGYRKTPGHRAWRNIRNRLKDAGLVEEFHAEVDKKVVNCLRLLKKFDPKSFQPKTFLHGHDDIKTEQLARCGRRRQIMDQLVELPIERQIYDMIDAAGSKGLTVTEVCKHLGINSKKNYTRLLNMFSRFGMHLKAESLNRGMAYRVWTSQNSPSTAIPSKSGVVLDNSEHSTRNIRYLVHEKMVRDSSTSKDEQATRGKMEDGNMEKQLCLGSCNSESGQMVVWESSVKSLVNDSGDKIPEPEVDSVAMVTESDVAQSEASPSNSPNPLKLRSCQRYPCLLTDVSTQREQRILERLQEEKFILTVELHKWLESFEKDKPTMMARKTLTRTLNKLQHEGLCKCIQVIVPVVTNCGRSRKTEVVLHPSIHSLPPEVLGQIHERLRAFDMQSRGQGIARLKNDKTVPVLTGVQRTHSRTAVDDQAARSEAMRTNGFVLAKMVRVNLLHNFLWGYLNGSSGLDNALSSGKHGYDLKNPHSTCKLFALQEAIKAMPLELFLQVVGSTYKFENLVENCRRGLCLSDLPLHTYKCLMNTQATGRFSWLVDILRRLKLIRLVTDGHAEEAERIPHAILSHAMELRPYIEEPLSVATASSVGSSVDLRPRIRHDFVLSSREAVDAYWKTLEYCYAAAYPPSALHAFPGSSVQEVFHTRSWASVRVMTADQRAQLLKRVVNDDPNKKLSFKECEKIARDLNLTFEQVLRVYSDKQQQRLNRFQQYLRHNDVEFQPEINKHGSTYRKRKRSSKSRSSKHVKTDGVTGKGDAEILPILSDIDSQYVEEENQAITSPGEHDILLQECGEQGTSKIAEELEENEVEEEEENDNYDLIRKCALSRFKPARQRKFSWTEIADRELVIQYVKHRAALGARFNRADWASLPGLPANPSTCRRRMTLLNSNLNFRKALMRFCNLLGERYAEHLDKIHRNETMNHDGCVQAVKDSSSVEGLIHGLSKGVENTSESAMMAQRWDDFEDPNIKKALDGVLQFIPMARMEARRRGRFISEKEGANLNFDGRTYDPHGEPELIPSTTLGEVQNHVETRQKLSNRRSGCHHIPGKFLKLLNEGTSVCRKAFESVAVSNAVELLKLVFLSTSTAPEVPNLLAETLRRYSQHDLFAAFSYLRQKKVMVGGTSSQPFVLSQQFLHSISSSPFPTNTGKRATKFSSWLYGKEEDLIEVGVNLSENLQCGDIFHLLAVVSSGELLISPCLPDEGIGEAEESKTLKHKTDKDELHPDEIAKKPKSLPTKDVDFRREKGFPGIMVCLTRTTISRDKIIELFKNDEICSSPYLFDRSEGSNFSYSLDTGSSLSLPNHLETSHNFCSIAPPAGVVKESQWEAMASYGQHLISTLAVHNKSSSLYPELFKKIYSNIQKAGDQGVSMEELCELIDMDGEKIAELIVDVLQVFGLIVKVNAYDCVHVVDALYRSKYLLTPAAGLYQGLKTAQPIISPRIGGNGYITHLSENHENAASTSQEETNVNLNNVHTVTILNLPEEVSQSSIEFQSGNEFQDHMNIEIVPMGQAHETDFFKCMSYDDSYRPILPWINGDGTTNMIVYRGLTRRILGTVMQNPGILEDDLINRIDVLNPQSCRRLLELMVLDNHLIVRKMYGSTSAAPPGILQSFLKGNFKKSESISHGHYFANSMSTFLL
ncbi:hypothetical protein NE237_006242 [Protea cynaroides]|uniref:B-block binding subunit of TFIIIC domain-containing protein n=1 Tax=Protea cynaroides TaxID=273540 RepID=A0A9Q0KLW0_9MAGN|nr:hypothetical protein NE237_006242 [Protea cynaroides]